MSGVVNSTLAVLIDRMNSLLNDPSVKNPYGALYNWYVVDPTNPHKIAPPGWHVPSDTEFTILTDYLIANGYNYDFTTTGNKIAKSMASNTNWTHSSADGAIGNDSLMNNKSGFSGQPGGYRYKIYGDFQNMHGYGMWWSTTEYDGAIALDSYLDFGNPSFRKQQNQKNCGFSIRLIRDN
jgi:uncharacterized protein (TIGR02145 family)